MPVKLPARNLRLLITRTDRIGDLVISTSVFPVLRKQFPSAHIAALTFLENREILEGNPFIDEVILYDKKGSEKSFFGNFLFARRLAKKQFDAVIHLHSTNRVHIAGFLAGIPVRIGWDRRSKWALTHPFPDVKAEGKKHEAEYNFDLLSPLGIKPPEKPETFFPVSEKAADSLDELFMHLKIKGGLPAVVLNPSASCPSKRWPPERFAELAARLHTEYDCGIFLIGGPQDIYLSDEIKKLAAAPVYDLTGRLSLSMLGAFLRRAALLISNDTGPVHVAAAVGTPVVSIFGRNQPGLSPARWKPLGTGSRIVWKDVGCTDCLAHNCQIKFLCLTEISVEDIMNSIRSFPSAVWEKRYSAGTADEPPLDRQAEDILFS